jgi:hypothetical protein
LKSNSSKDSLAIIHKVSIQIENLDGKDVNTKLKQVKSNDSLYLSCDTPNSPSVKNEKEISENSNYSIPKSSLNNKNGTTVKYENEIDDNEFNLNLNCEYANGHLETTPNNAKSGSKGIDSVKSPMDSSKIADSAHSKNVPNNSMSPWVALSLLKILTSQVSRKSSVPFNPNKSCLKLRILM